MRKEDMETRKRILEKLDEFQVENPSGHWENFERIMVSKRLAARRIHWRIVSAAAILLLLSATILLWQGATIGSETETRNNVPSEGAKAPGPPGTGDRSFSRQSQPETDKNELLRDNGVFPKRKTGATVPSGNTKTGAAKPGSSSTTAERYQAAGKKDGDNAGRPKPQERSIISLTGRTKKTDINGPDFAPETAPLIIVQNALANKSAAARQTPAGSKMEAGLRMGALFPIAVSPTGEGMPSNTGFTIGVYADRKLSERLSLLAEPSVALRTVENLRKSSTQKKYFMVREETTTQVNTRGIVSTDIPLSVALNLNPRHSFTAGLYGQLLINTVSSVSTIHFDGKTTSRGQENNVLNYRMGFARAGYGFTAGYMLRQGKRLRIRAIYFYELADMLDENYFGIEPVRAGELYVGVGYKVFEK